MCGCGKSNFTGPSTKVDYELGRKKYSNLSGQTEQQLVQYSGTAGNYLTQGSAALANLFGIPNPNQNTNAQAPPPPLPTDNGGISTTAIVGILGAVIVVSAVIYFVSKKK